MKNILIVAPHIDDEIISCGGSIDKFVKAGNKVVVVVVTNGNVSDPKLFPLEGTKRGRKEALKAHEILGISKTYFFDFPALKLDTFPGYKISLELVELIKKEDVNVLFLPHRGDIHTDHRAVFEAGLVAARPIDGSPVRSIYTYETLSETEWSAPYAADTFFPTLYIEISKENLEQKIKAFNCYTAPRRKEYPHPRSEEGLRTLAAFRGGTIEKRFAEAFMHVRTLELV